MATVFRQAFPSPQTSDSADSHVSQSQPVEATFINRDLSLLEFFKRVLDEALDRRLPILERLKFLAIFSSNLDEFFMIRVSGLKEKVGEAVESPDGYTRQGLLAEIKTRVSEMTD